MPPQANKPATLESVWRWALQGDLRAALHELDQLPFNALSTDDRALATRLRERFSSSPPPADTPDPFVSAVVSAYRRYWSKAMLRERTLPEAEAYLQEQLAALLSSQGDLRALTDALGQQLEARGYRSLRGVTQPYWELMVWTTEETRSYDVVLPETQVQVQVILLDGFVSLGWTAFATCDRLHSGGWATKEALYCVRSAYDLQSETFSVSYLAHEAQHFADNAAFPKLEQPELEYRAKLAELSLAKETARGLLRAFAARGGTDRRSPHGLANGWVARGILRALGTNDCEELPAREINQGARTLLRQHSAALREAGSETVQRCAPEGETGVEL